MSASPGCSGCLAGLCAFGRDATAFLWRAPEASAELAKGANFVKALSPVEALLLAEEETAPWVPLEAARSTVEATSWAPLAEEEVATWAPLEQAEYCEYRGCDSKAPTLDLPDFEATSSSTSAGTSSTWRGSSCSSSRGDEMLSRVLQSGGDGVGGVGVPVPVAVILESVEVGLAPLDDEASCAACAWFGDPDGDSSMVPLEVPEIADDGDGNFSDSVSCMPRRRLTELCGPRQKTSNLVVLYDRHVR
mmetsp:Transcript_88120/g.189177  ORF Transcript_88120/g.189177 Transcript_88120/m.189177 type:complete len:248 (-) Transcript_88120:34-777(-)